LKVAAPLADLFGTFVVEMRGAYDDETRKTWVIYARKFVHHFGTLSAITAASIGDYTRARLRQVLRDTVSKERHALGVFLGWCKEQGYLLEAPTFPAIPKGATGVRSGTQRAKPVDITPEQAIAFLEALPERSARALKRGEERFHVRGFFEVLWFTGLRPATVEALEVPTHYARGSSTLTITDEIDKARFGRELTLTPGAMRALERCAPDAGVIFGRHNLSKQVAKAKAKAAMPTGFAPYDLRHGRATSLLEATGDDLLAVAYMLGHKRTTTTDRYLHTNRRAGDRAAAAVAGEELPAARVIGCVSGVVLGVPMKTVRCAPEKAVELWGDRRGSNPRQLEPQSSALPTELRPP